MGDHEQHVDNRLGPTARAPTYREGNPTRPPAVTRCAWPAPLPLDALLYDGRSQTDRQRSNLGLSGGSSCGGPNERGPYVITAGATLGGVAITGVLAEYRERRRSREERERERDRVIEERLKWLRQERRQSYARLIDVGYEAASLLLEASSRVFDSADPDAARELWPTLDQLRDTIRAKVADVELVGSAAVVDAAYELRSVFRRAPDVLLTCASIRDDPGRAEELSSAMAPKVRAMFRVVQRLTEVAKRDLRIDTGSADGSNQGEEAETV